MPEYYLSLGEGICTSRLQSGLTGAHQKKEWKGTFYPEDQVLSEGRLTIGSAAGPHHHDITTVSGGGVGGARGGGGGSLVKAGEYLEPAALPNPDQLLPILASTLL